MEKGGIGHPKEAKEDGLLTISDAFSVFKWKALFSLGKGRVGQGPAGLEGLNKKRGSSEGYVGTFAHSSDWCSEKEKVQHRLQARRPEEGSTQVKGLERTEKEEH